MVKIGPTVTIGSLIYPFGNGLGLKLILTDKWFHWCSFTIISKVKKNTKLDNSKSLRYSYPLLPIILFIVATFWIVALWKAPCLLQSHCSLNFRMLICIQTLSPVKKKNQRYLLSLSFSNHSPAPSFLLHLWRVFISVFNFFFLILDFVVGTLPSSFGEMTSLNHLDLLFNSISGLLIKNNALKIYLIFFLRLKFLFFFRNNSILNRVIESDLLLGFEL